MKFRLNFKKIKTNNTASIGDKIHFKFKGLDAYGYVRVVLNNSVITSLIIKDETSYLYKKLKYEDKITDETVVNFRKYQIEEWNVDDEQ